MSLVDRGIHGTNFFIATNITSKICSKRFVQYILFLSLLHNHQGYCAGITIKKICSYGLVAHHFCSKRFIQYILFLSLLHNQIMVGVPFLKLFPWLSKFFFASWSPIISKLITRCGYIGHWDFRWKAFQVFKYHIADRANLYISDTNTSSKYWLLYNKQLSTDK